MGGDRGVVGGGFVLVTDTSGVLTTGLGFADGGGGGGGGSL